MTARHLPFEALFELGQIGLSAEAVQFLRDCADDGWGIDQPGDEDLPEEEYRENVIMRARILRRAWEAYKARMEI